MRDRQRTVEVSMQSEDRDIDAGQDDALPSVETTRRFLALCDRYGSHHEAVAAVLLAGGRACTACPSATPGRSGTRPKCVQRSSTFSRRRRRPDQGYLARPRRGLFARRRTASAGESSGGTRPEEQVAMSKSGILDALRNEERSLRSPLVAIQRAIEAIEGSVPQAAGRGRKKAAKAAGGASARRARSNAGQWATGCASTGHRAERPRRNSKRRRSDAGAPASPPSGRCPLAPTGSTTPVSRVGAASPGGWTRQLPDAGTECRAFE